MNRLFEESETRELPKAIIDVELDDVEAIVLKLLVLIDKPFQKTEIKSIARSIISSVSSYSSIKNARIDESINSLLAKGVIIQFNSGFGIHPKIVFKIFPLAKDNLLLIRAAISYFTSQYYYNHHDIVIRLSILANDFDSLNKLTRISQSYNWSSSTEQLRNALLSLGDLSYIKPLLSRFHEHPRDLFLNTLPFSLYYEYFDQLKDIYLDPTIQIDSYSKYVYASCANLILPVSEVVEITHALGINKNSLFFAKLLQGDLDDALFLASIFLIDIQEEEGHKKKELPGAFGLLYGIALLVAGGPKNFTLASTFIRSAIKNMPHPQGYDNPFNSFAQIILLFINHKIGKKTTSVNEMFLTYQKVFHQQFLTAVLNWFGKPMKGASYPSFINEKEEFEFRASGLMTSDDTPEYCEKRLAELRSKFDFVPLAELFQPEEIWEDVLAILANELSNNKNVGLKDGNTPEKRLIWLVDPLDQNSVTCLEQSKNKNGWNKGKERSISRMLSLMPDFSLKEDRAIIECFQKSNYYNELHVKDWHKLVRALSAHPEVYTVTEPHLPLKIRIQEAQIQIDKNKQGATIKLNPSSPEPRIVKESSTSYLFTHWSARAMQVYTVLAESKLKEIVIPQSGMEKAKPVIERLNEVMPVAGNFTQNSAKTKKSESIPVFQLTPVDNRLHVQLLIEVIEGEDARFIPGIGSAEVLVKSSKNEVFNIQRDRSREKNILVELAERIDWLQEMKSTSAQLFIDNDEEILDFLAEVKEHAPEVKIIWPKGERLKVAKVLTIANFKININKSQDWFALDAEVVIDEKLKLNIQQLLEQSKGGALKYIQLDDKTYLSICSDLQKRLAALDAVAHKKGSKLLVHALGSASIEKFVEGVEDVKSDKLWKQHLDSLDQLKSYTPSLPDNLQAELRPYQEEGVCWLDRLHNWGVGACLADDMGLGKTIQAISILLKYAKNGASLVLAPASVCSNWINELNRFAPTLNPVEFKSQNRDDVLSNLKAHDILVMSYGLLQANPDLLDKRDWNIVILDEAHAIKNAKSVRSQAVMKLNAKFKIITTGTPIQNHLGELWNLFQFINPGMLGTSEQFVKKFVQTDNASDSQQIRKQLTRYISPFILRRNKNDVLDDLPEKTEITLHVSLSDQERAMYEVLRQEAIEQITGNEAQGGAKHLQILAEITKLRQMSCHPQLVVPDSDIPSSKLEALEVLVDDLIEANHKALIFSQFTKHLALIRAMLDKKGISYQYLDGSTPLNKRELAIDNFQNGMSDLFLISLKAGGVGLNLTAADYVIHMDPWWNPAVEDQASDRIHRIGQKRPVTIYRIIAENTIEEKIVKMHHNKRDLADKLLANTDQSAKISSEELLGLITENY